MKEHDIVKITIKQVKVSVFESQPPTQHLNSLSRKEFLVLMGKG